MKSFVFLSLFICASLSTPFVFAAKSQKGVKEDYATQLQWLQNAFNSAGLPVEKIEEFKDFQKGKNNYHVNANNAPWAGHWWPWKNGGISYRWQAPPPKIIRAEESNSRSKVDQLETDMRIHYKTLDEGRSYEALLTYLKTTNLNALSPVEKFDIYVGDYQFNATKHTKLKRGPERKKNMLSSSWQGYCNGARAAGALMPEPQHSITVTNPDGIKVKFEIADLKALGASSYFFGEFVSNLGYPTRGFLTVLVPFPFARNTYPPNMALFDIALRAYLADSGKVFFMDTASHFSVQNAAIVGYERKIIPHKEKGITTVFRKVSKGEQELHPGVVKKIKVETTLKFLAEIIDDSEGHNINHKDVKMIIESNKSTKQLVARGKWNQKKDVSYELFLDANNRIVDGELSGLGPDLYWFAAGRGYDDTFFSDFLKEYPGNRDLKWDRVKELFDLAAKI
jgi:hypothetical protein